MYSVELGFFFFQWKIAKNCEMGFLNESKPCGWTAHVGVGEFK